MNFLYNKQIATALVTVAIATSACGQHAKVKTITIINGDTTISESNLDEKDISKMEKEISVMIDGNEKSDKKIVKKIVINEDGKEDGKNAEAMAYAYSIGDGDDQNVEVITDGKDGETKIIIRNGDKEKGDKNEKGEKKVIVRKSIGTDDDKTEKESMNLNINVKGTTAKVEVETSSKEPLNVSVLDESGKQVFYDTQKSGGKYSKEILLGKKGTYFLNLIQNKKSTSERIVVE